MTASEKPRVFITGATGQDGYYLARLLLSRGHSVTAGVRRTEAAGAGPMLPPGINLLPFDLLAPESIDAALDAARPDEVYHLAGISSVGETWKLPAMTMRVNAEGTVHLLEALRRRVPHAHLVLAGSGECFDHEAAGEDGINPGTPLLCTNPYSISKVAAMKFVQCYREQHGLRASVAILLNHTSPRRPSHFVERRIVRHAVRVSRGLEPRLLLGSLGTRRDWSWAEDIVEGLAALGACARPGDFVFASGTARTTGDWVRLTFERLGLDPARHLEISTAQLHRGDRPHTRGEIGPARELLGWSPRTSFEQIVCRLIEAELNEESAP